MTALTEKKNQHSFIKCVQYVGYYNEKEVRWINSNLGSGKGWRMERRGASRLLQINRVKSRKQQ